MDVLFLFGYGLSYTSFAYDNLQIEKIMADIGELKKGGTIQVRVDVTNTGS